MKDKEDLGIKIAPNERAATLERLREATEKRILDTEVSLELERNALDYVKKELKKAGM